MVLYWILYLSAYFCEIPNHPANGEVDCNNPLGTTSLVHGDRCSFNCDSGFELNGEAELGCTDNSQLSAALPTCERTQPLFMFPHIHVMYLISGDRSALPLTSDHRQRLLHSSVFVQSG